MFKTMKQIIKNKSSVRVRSEFLLPSSWKLSGQSSSRETADWDTSSGVCFSSSSETQGQWVGPGEKARRKFSSTGGRAPGYRLSQDHFQMVKRKLAPDWAQKMLCIIVTNRQTVSPEFFSSVRFVHDGYYLATVAPLIFLLLLSMSLDLPKTMWCA